MSEKITQIVEELKTLTLLEASELVAQIEETFGVDASAAAGGGMVMAAAAPAEEVEVLRGKLEEKNCALKEVKEVNIEVSKSLKEMSGKYKAASREKLNLEIENNELKERLEELSEKVKSQEKIRLETRNLDESEVELMAFDYNELKLENQKFLVSEV